MMKSMMGFTFYIFLAGGGGPAELRASGTPDDHLDPWCGAGESFRPSMHRFRAQV